MIILPGYQSQTKKGGIDPVSSKLTQQHSEFSQSCSRHSERQRLQGDLDVASQYLKEYWVLMKRRERDLLYGERVTGPGQRL